MTLCAPRHRPVSWFALASLELKSGPFPGTSSLFTQPLAHVAPYGGHSRAMFLKWTSQSHPPSDSSPVSHSMLQRDLVYFHINLFAPSHPRSVGL